MFSSASRNKRNKPEPLNRAFRIAIVDLGTNSVRFAVHLVSPRLESELIYREKVMVRLGDEVFGSGKLNEDASRRTLEAFRGFSDKIAELEADHVVAFATCALRTASNASKFIKQVKKETGIRIEIISGKEEARLIAKGILNNERPKEALVALVDIGGGSTEINLCHKATVLESLSFPIGANRLQQLYLKSSPPLTGPEGEDPIFQFSQYIKKCLDPICQDSRWMQVETLIGSSGTVRAIEKILRKSGHETEPFTGAQLDELVVSLLPMGKDELSKVPGLEEKRQDLILSGALIMGEIIEALQAKRVYRTGFSLREGILEHQIEQVFLGRFK